MSYTKTTFVNGGAPAINQTNLNNNEGGTHKAYYQSEAITLNDATVTLTYTGGNLTSVAEVISGNTIRSQSLTYSGGNLTSVTTIIYDQGSTTIDTQYTDTLSYTSGNLTSVSRSVV